MNMSQLNTKLLKTQQERIDILEAENKFFKELCKKLSAPIKKTEKV